MTAETSAKPRVLFCVTVYNGELFVPRTLESALRIDTAHADIDVLVLDDASPAPGWSARLAELCDRLGIGYYCTPRNLGIPRNVSLGMIAAIDGDYDYVVISNSDVIYPRNLMSQMLRAVNQEGVGSVTAWSNNVSLYSLPNEDPDLHLSDQDRVDWISGVLADHYGDAVMDVPAGISFSIIMPIEVVKKVGVMDPVFGRGYCEETDWSLRSLAAGYRIGLAPGTFVYHQGRGSNLDAGLVSHDHTTVPENEAIIDLRYPLFRTQVDAFASSGVLSKAHKDAQEAIIRATGRSFGYTVHIGWLPPVAGRTDLVQVQVAPDGRPEVRMHTMGFEATLELDGVDLAAELRQYFGSDPAEVNLTEHGPAAAAFALAFGTGVISERLGNYPARV